MLVRVRVRVPEVLTRLDNTIVPCKHLILQISIDRERERNDINT